MSDGYNGWKNYETWNCSLWLNNDEQHYRAIRRMVSDAIDDARVGGDDRISLPDWTRRDHAIYLLARMLETYVDEHMCEGIESASGFVRDLFHAALSEVNYKEIAESELADEEIPNANPEDDQ